MAERLREQLTCTLHLDLFEDPRMLPCMHVFCQGCLAGLVKSKPRAFDCPLCRQSCVVPADGAESFPKAYHINDLFETLRQLEQQAAASSTQTCQSCQNEPASHGCIDCEEVYGPSCTSVHRTLRVSRNHVLVDLAEFPARLEAARLAKEPMCSEHPSEACRIYCQECQRVVCRDCVLLEHRNHRFDSVAKLAKVERDRLMVLLAKTTELLPEAELNLAKAEDAVVGLEKSRNVAVQHIETVFDELFDALHVCKRHLSDEVAAANEKQSKNLSAQVDAYHSRVVGLRSICDYARLVHERGTDHELFSVCKQLQQQHPSLGNPIETGTLWVDLSTLKKDVVTACSSAPPVQTFTECKPTAFGRPASGEVMAWGDNRRGQLGLGHDNHINTPQLVAALSGKKVVAIAAGLHHSLVLLASGKVMAWGNNDCGQLGLGHNNDMNTPQLVAALSGKKVVAIAAGSSHILVLLASAVAIKASSCWHRERSWPGATMGMVSWALDSWALDTTTT
eukprot:TRINITY_DN898_c0_g1_i2.p1 TRINITY_DN898_c0_g1~~TRINITY_DN898_c0_g1_i2.p1  ORF type:complete len:535 (-),score=39.28 TRINITY_DN898_c0_g1_i2:1118-2638(-)